jgi:hypothetical protein
MRSRSTDDEREAIQSGIAAMEKCGWTHRVPVLRAILARQPAAIDKQAMTEIARKWIKKDSDASPEFYWGDFYDCVAEIISSAEASKPAAPSVEQDERELIELLRNVCHYADSVCGMLRQGGWPGKAEALESRIKAVIDFDANSRDKETDLPCPICNGVEGCDHTVPERARAASTSANVAQGAEAVAWFIPDDNGEVYRTTGYEHERDQWRALGHAVFPLYTAPPAQTAITEQMLEKLYWTAMDNSADILKYMEEAIALTAAQSASGETK